MRKICIVLLLILLSTPLIFARPTKGIAIGAQVGPLATGAVADFPLGPVSLSLSIGTPLMVNYIMGQSGDVFDTTIAPFFIVTGDFTYPIALGEHFDLKVGISTLAGTDFEYGIIGVAGGTIKGEYWIPNKNIGIFMQMGLPILAYVGGPDIGLVTTVNWAIPLLGIFTSTAGVLWTF
ncbi:MAG: hypothetical protein GX842_02880 [Spirochaetales bacterium]|nr:hypothetical protein [Spirochaetales bacterium]